MLLEQGTNSAASNCTRQNHTPAAAPHCLETRERKKWRERCERRRSRGLLAIEKIPTSAFSLPVWQVDVALPVLPVCNRDAHCVRCVHRTQCFRNTLKKGCLTALAGPSEAGKSEKLRPAMASQGFLFPGRINLTRSAAAGSSVPAEQRSAQAVVNPTQHHVGCCRIAPGVRVSLSKPTAAAER